MRLQNDFSVLTMQGIQQTIDCSLDGLQMNNGITTLTHDFQVMGM